jgi:pyruvate dehydrogenase E2 component (dihydrolipoamide acetyltransferase)
MPKEGSPVTSETPEKQLAPAAPAASASAPIAPPAREAGTRIVATPLARRIARQNSIDLGQVDGSGPRGRIKADDVRAAIPALAAMPREGARQIANPARRAPTSYEATVARRLSEAKRETPHFYLATEVDAGRLLDLKDQLNDEISGVKISVNHLIIAAVAKALAENEKANSVWQEGEIVTYDSVDIGVAVNTDNGLFAPVLKNLGGLDIVSIAAAAKAMVEKARSGKLAGDDLAGGATTISNAGMFDVTYMSSIINPGQSSILGVGSIRETFRPNKKGKPVLKQEMGLVLSCDHRIFDGVSGLTFLNAIKSYLEKPLKLLVK